MLPKAERLRLEKWRSVVFHGEGLNIVAHNYVCWAYIYHGFLVCFTVQNSSLEQQFCRKSSLVSVSLKLVNAREADRFPLQIWGGVVFHGEGLTSWRT